MGSLPCAVGAGFKPSHFDELLAAPGPVDWVEVHAENYLMDGGAMRAQLFELRSHMPVSLHGVGLSLGGEEPPDKAHLARLRQLIEALEPAQFSEHLAWSRHGAKFTNDLLPISYDAASLTRMCDHVDTVQQAFGRQILIENPSLYMRMVGLDGPYAETEFLSSLVAKTGCGLLLDVNNIYVTCQNLGWPSDKYLRGLPLHAVGEVHLAGHTGDVDDTGQPVLIDNHGGPVAEPVWLLYRDLLQQAGPLPTLVEWDNNIPDWRVLRDECAKASALLTQSQAAEVRVA